MERRVGSWTSRTTFDANRASGSTAKATPGKTNPTRPCGPQVQLAPRRPLTLQKRAVQEFTSSPNRILTPSRSPTSKQKVRPTVIGLRAKCVHRISRPPSRLSEFEGRRPNRGKQQRHKVRPLTQMEKRMKVKYGCNNDGGSGLELKAWKKSTRRGRCRTAMCATGPDKSPPSSIPKHTSQSDVGVVETSRAPRCAPSV